MANKVNKRKFLKEHHKASKGLEMWRIFKSNRLAVAGLVILAIILLLLLFADVIANYDAMVVKPNPLERLQFPGGSHLFGTDDLGRDEFARIIHGGRVSLRIALLSGIVGLFLAGVVGSVAGFYGGVLDNVLMRIVDVMACIPCMVLAITMVAVMGTSETNLVLAIGISTMVGMCRTVRSSVLSVRNMEYIEAARAIGLPTWKIITKHLLMNCIAPIIVHFTIQLACNILWISSLSFLGLGISAPTPEWGCMIAAARTNMRQYPYLVIYPGMAIFFSAVSFNLIGDGFRDALDPKLKR